MNSVNYSFVRSLMLLSTVSAVIALNARAAEFAVDPAHSSVNFEIRHLVSEVNGAFKDYKGQFKFDDAKGVDLSDVNFTIQAASISTNNDKRDGHLRSPDFFNVEKYPTINFVGKKVTKSGKNKFKVDGDLTLLGVTKPATWTVEYAGVTPNMEGTPTAGFKAETKINRKDYGMVWNKVLDKGPVLGDEVKVSVDIEAQKVAAATTTAPAAKTTKK